MLESGLSADVELRERKGGWLVRNWSLAAVFRVLAMALYDGIDKQCRQRQLSHEGRLSGEQCQTLDKHFDVETGSDSIC